MRFFRSKNIPIHYKIAIIYTLILFLDRADITIINVAIPFLSKLFNIDIALTDWLSTSFLIGLSISIGVSYWFGEKYGYKKTFLYSIAGFAIFSAFCSLSTSFSQFVFFRFLQGLCGGVIIPTGNALLYMSCHKKDYARVTNFAFLPTLIAPALAPYLGGIIMKYFSYKAIFFLNLPICALVIMLGWLIIKEEQEFEKKDFDSSGFFLSSMTYISFFIAISYISQSNLPYALFYAASCALLAWQLIRTEKSQTFPLIDFKYLKNDLFSKALLIQLFFQIGHFGSFFVIGLYLQIGIGFPPEQAGLIVAMQALGAILVTIPSKKLFYKHGAVLPIAMGFVGISLITPLILLISSTNQINFACLIMFIRGLFSGWVGTPMHTISMLDSQIGKKDLGQIGAMFNSARQLSISMGICVSAVLIGISEHLWNFGYQSNQLSYANSLRLFSPAVLSISLSCWLGLYVTLKINNIQILKAIANDQP